MDYTIQFNLDSFYRKHCHDLRHFHASACASAGIPIERVGKYMGNADIGAMHKLGPFRARQRKSPVIRSHAESRGYLSCWGTWTRTKNN